MEILHSIGIEPKLLVAQAINFGLLLFVLYKFLYNPILKLLNERTKKIEKSLKDAEEVAKKLEETEIEKGKVITSAKTEASAMVKEAKIAGEEVKVGIIKEAEAKSKELLKNAKEDIEKEKELVLKEVKNEVAELVSRAMRTIVDKDGEKYDEKLIKEAISEVAKARG